MESAVKVDSSEEGGKELEIHSVLDKLEDSQEVTSHCLVICSAHLLYVHMSQFLAWFDDIDSQILAEQEKCYRYIIVHTSLDELILICTAVKTGGEGLPVCWECEERQHQKKFC